MLYGKMTFRKILLWLGVVPLILTSWLVCGCAWQLYKTLRYVFDNAPALLPLLLK